MAASTPQPGAHADQQPGAQPGTQPVGATGPSAWRIVLVALVVLAVVGALITVMVRSSQDADSQSTSQSTPASPTSQRTSADAPNATARGGDAGASKKNEGDSERSTANGTTSSAAPTTNQAEPKASEPSGSQDDRADRDGTQAHGGSGHSTANAGQTAGGQGAGAQRPGRVDVNRGQTDPQAGHTGQSAPSARTVGSPQGGEYAVVAKNPTAAELSGIIQFLTQTDAGDQAKLKNLENPAALVVPQTVSRMGLFRAPRGSSRVDGPVTVQGDMATAQLNAQSAGTPTVSIPINFVYRDGNWRLASSSMCNGVKTLGLPIFCNG